MHSYTQTNFYFGLIIAVFGLGIYKFNWLFIIVPFMIFVQYSIVQFNQYHGFLAEVFLSGLEKKINKLVKANSGVDPNLNFFTYYNFLYHKTYLVRDKEMKFPILKPTMLLAMTLAIVNLFMLIYSSYESYMLLSKLAYGIALNVLFLGLSLFVLLLLMFNFTRMPKKIKPTFHNIYHENFTEDPFFSKDK